MAVDAWLAGPMDLSAGVLAIDIHSVSISFSPLRLLTVDSILLLCCAPKVTQSEQDLDFAPPLAHRQDELSAAARSAHRGSGSHIDYLLETLGQDDEARDGRRTRGGGGYILLYSRVRCDAAKDRGRWNTGQSSNLYSFT
jgi:hypothetical protein